jgi:8-hydroxy-5-deazaflavin:NADPH oxidoreductase
MTMPMTHSTVRIAVIGAGNIGATLARAWAAVGHQIILGVRDTATPKVLTLADQIGATVATVAEAATSGEVVSFAIPGPAMADTVKALAAELNGKIVIDTANKITGPVLNSVADITAHAPRAHVYRAFNSFGLENFAGPGFGSQQAGLFYCGPDGESRQLTEALISDVGLRPVRVGDIDTVDLVDSIVKLWFALFSEQGKGRHLAFKVLTG